METVTLSSRKTLSKMMGAIIIATVGLSIFSLILSRVFMIEFNEPVLVDLVMSVTIVMIATKSFNCNIKDLFKDKEQQYQCTSSSKISLITFMVAVSAIIFIVMQYATGIYKMDILGAAFLPKVAGNNFVVSLVIGGFVLPVFNEIFFRGILLENLKSQGAIFAIVVASLVQALFSNTAVVSTFLIALMLGSIYIYTNNIKTTIVFSQILNLLAVYGPIFITKVYPKASFLSIVMIIAALLVPVAILAYLKCKKDEKMQAFFNKFNIKEMVNDVKKDKNKYWGIFDSPAFLIYLFVFLYMEIQIFSVNIF